MNTPFTITPERSELALDAAYELHALGRLIRDRATIDTPELRGIGLRVESLSTVLMAVVDGAAGSENEEGASDLRSIVHGDDPEPE